MTASRLTVFVDASQLLALTERLKRALEVRQGLLGLPDFPKGVACVDLDSRATGAHEMRIRLQPSDRLRSFAAAVFAGDIDG